MTMPKIWRRAGPPAALLLLAAGGFAAALAAGAEPQGPAAADLLVTLAGPGQVAPGAAGLRYDLGVRNQGADAAAAVSLTGTLPAGFRAAALSPGGSLLAGGQAIRWELGALPAGEARAVSATLAVSRSAPLGPAQLQAEARAATPDGAPGDNAAALPLEVGGADLRLSLAPAAPSARPGEAMTHTLTLANVSKREAQGLAITITLASSTSFLADDALAQGFSRHLVPGGLRLERPRLPGLATVFIQLASWVPAETPVGAQLVVAGALATRTLDEEPDNDVATAAPVTVVLPDFWLTKTGPAEAGVGSELEYTLRYGNRGSGAAPAVAITDRLPAGLSYTGGSPPATVLADGSLAWELGVLPPGAEDLVRVRARVGPTLTLGSRILNRAAGRAGRLEAPTADNAGAAEAVVVAGPPADLDLALPEAVPVSTEALPIGIAVADAGGNPVVDGTEVRLSASRGTLGATLVRTAGGTAATTLAPGHQAGSAVVTATAGQISAERAVTLLPGPPASLRPSPATGTPTVGDDVVLSVAVADAFGNAVADGTPVTATVTLGSVAPETARTVGGQVALVWRSTVSGEGTLAVGSGGVLGGARRSFAPGPAALVALELAAEQLPVGDGQAVLTARVLDRYSNPIATSEQVRFSAGGGQVSPATVMTTKGVAVASYRAGAVPGTFTAKAEAGALSATRNLVLRPADLSLAVADVQGPRGRARDTQTHPGDPLTYTIAVRNEGLARARDVVLGLSLPAQWEVSDVRVAGAAGTNERPSVPPGLLEPPAADRVQRAWALPDLPEGAGAELVLTGPVSREASWTGRDSLFFQSAVTSTTAVARPAAMRKKDTAGVFTADLFVNVQLDSLASQLVPGGTAVYDLTFGNRQPLTELSSVRITDTLPTWMTFDHWEPLPGTTLRELGRFDAEARELVWEALPPFGIGAGFRLWLAIDPGVPPEARFENRVRIGADVQDISPADDRASDGGVGLSGVNLVALVSGPETVAAGQSIDYDVRVRNSSLTDGARNVVVDSYPPHGVVVEQVEPAGQTNVEGRLRWQLEALGPNSETWFRVRVRVPEALALGSLLRHRVEVASQDQDRYLGDNSAERVTRVVAGPPATVRLAAGRPALVVCADTVEPVVLSAEVRDARGNPVADGTPVRWATTAGELSRAETQTTGGSALVTLAPGEAGPAAVAVTALAGAASGALALDFVAGPPASLTLAAEPASVRAGAETRLLAEVRDGCGYPVLDGTPLRFAAERGSFPGGGAAASVATLAGRAEARLAVGETLGRLTVVARHDSVSAETAVEVLPRLGPSPTPTRAPPAVRIWLPFLTQRLPR